MAASLFFPLLLSLGFIIISSTYAQKYPQIKSAFSDLDFDMSVPCPEWFFNVLDFMINAMSHKTSVTNPFSQPLPDSKVILEWYNAVDESSPSFATNGAPTSAKHILDKFYTGIATTDFSSRPTAFTTLSKPAFITYKCSEPIFPTLFPNTLARTDISKLFAPAHRNDVIFDAYRNPVWCGDGSGELDSFSVCDSVITCEDGSDEAPALCDFGSEYGYIPLGSEYASFRQLCDGEATLTNGIDETLEGTGLSCVAPPAEKKEHSGLKAFFRSPHFRAYMMAKRRAEGKEAK